MPSRIGRTLLDARVEPVVRGLFAAGFGEAVFTGALLLRVFALLLEVLRGALDEDLLVLSGVFVDLEGME